MKTKWISLTIDACDFGKDDDFIFFVILRRVNELKAIDFVIVGEIDERKCDDTSSGFANIAVKVKADFDENKFYDDEFKRKF